ncbi:hypothetical protein GFL15_04515 [Rhizobium leguminosarum bv. viciae]|nr:hypothetical protein [Rhizobium leguminosarum bv. viciae]
MRPDPCVSIPTTGKAQSGSDADRRKRGPDPGAVATIIPATVVLAVALIAAVEIAIVARPAIAAALTLVDDAAFRTVADTAGIKSAAVDGLGSGGPRRKNRRR